MDQYFAEIIVVLITGVFSVISLIIQKRQDKVVDNINKKTVFMEKERDLKKRIDDLSRERETIIHNMMILILKSNVELMKTMESSDDNSEVSSFHQQIYDSAKLLEESFEKTNEKLEDINHEYQIVITMAREAQAEIDRLQQNKK